MVQYIIKADFPTPKALCQLYIVWLVIAITAADDDDFFKYCDDDDDEPPHPNIPCEHNCTFSNVNYLVKDFWISAVKPVSAKRGWCKRIQNVFLSLYYWLHEYHNTDWAGAPVVAAGKRL